MPDKPNRQTNHEASKKDGGVGAISVARNCHGSHFAVGCPWEIGYANGRQLIDQIIVAPTINGSTVYGIEYLSLYRRLELTVTRELAVWQSWHTSNGVRVSNL